MVRSLLIAVAFAAAAAGALACSPRSPAACSVACGPEDSCPSGMSCGADGLCYGGDQAPGSCTAGDPDGGDRLVPDDGGPTRDGGDPAVDAGDSPDANVDVCPTPCDEVAQCGCGGGEGCYVAEEGDRYCDDAGDGDADSECDHDDDCAVGYDCVATRGGSDAERCHAYCEGDADCGGMARCTRPTDDGSARACSSDCDPVTATDAPACQDGDSCQLGIAPNGRYDALCTQPGNGGQHAGCDEPADCGAGLTCVVDGGTTSCQYVCHLADGAGCVDGETCVALTPAASLGGVAFGLCRVD